MKQPGKGILITVIVLAVISGVVAIFRYMNPGLYFKYKCNQPGDDTRKFYGDNWQARGAVCQGFYIPFGSKLNGQDPIKVLEIMASMTNTVPTDAKSMKSLAESAATPNAGTGKGK